MKAYLLPNQHTILVKTGNNYGISTLIKRRKFKGKFQTPVRYENTEIWIYPDFTVRNTQGKFLGYYVGYEQDRLTNHPKLLFNSHFGGMGHDIFIRFQIEDTILIAQRGVGHEEGMYLSVKPGEVHAICPVYIRTKFSNAEVVISRMGWEQRQEIKDFESAFDLKGLTLEEKIATINEFIPSCLLKAALEYQKM